VTQLASRVSQEPNPAKGIRKYDLIDNDRVAAAYSLLINPPGVDLEQFTARLHSNEAEARAILNRLTDLALLSPIRTEHGQMHTEHSTLVAVSPLAAMQQLMYREQDILRQRQQFLHQSADIFSLILSTYGGSPDHAYAEHANVEQLTDLPAVRRRLQELAMSAKDQVLSFSPAATNPAAARLASRPLDLAALARGVQMQTIYTDTIALDPDWLTYAQEMVDAGAEVRLAAKLPMRMIVIDSTAAIVPRNPNNDVDGAFIIRQETFVLGLLALFECYWNLGRPLPSAVEDLVDCSSVELAVVRLLATGAKDDAVARQLGTSVRTVRRVVRTLMTRAKVNSRYAFGVFVAGHEWLERGAGTAACGPRDARARPVRRTTRPALPERTGGALSAAATGRLTP
jgi:DNA-binding CsgD family transcriptional regulator